MKMPDVTNSYQSKTGLGSSEMCLLIWNNLILSFLPQSYSGPHSKKIYWEAENLRSSSLRLRTHMTALFLVHSCRTAPKEQHKFSRVPFSPCSKT